MSHTYPVEVIEVLDVRTSDQQMLDINEANALRQSAERFERRGQFVLATLFRNSAWCLEKGHGWLSDANLRELSQRNGGRQ